MTSELPAQDDRFFRENGVAAAVAEAIMPSLVDLGFRLVRVVISGRDGQTLQIMAERPDGTMSAADCERVSKQISPLLDVLDPLSGAYRLEISSPGIDRPLVRATDFEDWAGYEARVTLKELVSGRKKYKGVLDGYEDGEARIEIEIAEKGEAPRQEIVGFPIDLVDEARLVLTDDLIRESLRRAKKAREQSGIAEDISPAEDNT